MAQVIIAKVIMAKWHSFNIRVWGGGWGVWNGGLRFGDLGLVVWENLTSVCQFYLLSHSCHYYLPFLSVLFLPKII